ncbi:MAG: metalloregulator ArsR/SmtB family transcription factor [Acidobacteriaceae bacterium]
MDDVFKALGDESRRKLLHVLLWWDGLTLTELHGKFPGVSRQAVSKHLKVLELAGMVTVVRRGKEKLHFLNAKPLYYVSLEMEPYKRAWLEKVKN